MPRAICSRLRRVLGILGLVIAVGTPTAARADIAYFVSKTNGGLYTFDTSGTAITALTGTNTFPNATALAMGSDGNLYVGDSTGGGSIKRYVMASGSVSTVVTLNGSGPTFTGSPVSPGAIAFTSGGGMLVGRNPEVAFFPGGVAAWPGGAVLNITGWRVGESASISSYTSGTAQNYSPGLALASDGTLYASNSFYDAQTFIMTGNVLKFDGSGAYQSVTAADASGSGGLFGPSGLGVSGNSLYIASTMDGNVYKTDLTNPDTSLNTTVFGSTGGDYIGPLSVLSDGGLLVGSVASSGLMYRFDTAGNLINTIGGASYGAIGGIVAVPEPSAVFLAVAGAACMRLWRLRGRRGA
jgi:sugar lactone lactonase YvrE